MKKLSVMAAILATTVSIFAFSSDAVLAANGLDICCAWNTALADGTLNYTITGGSAVDRSTVAAAVEEWDAGVPGLTLNDVSGTGQTGDIKITLKKGGGVIAGQAKRSGDRSGFVKSVTISISLKAFGAVNDQDTIAEVARHEFGHALGLGHANFDDLMDPTVGGANTISNCDVDGVQAANKWALVDHLSTPQQPLSSSISC